MHGSSANDVADSDSDAAEGAEMEKDIGEGVSDDDAGFDFDDGHGKAEQEMACSSATPSFLRAAGDSNASPRV